MSINTGFIIVFKHYYNTNNDSLSFRVLKLQIQREMKEKKEHMNTESFIIKKCYSIWINDHGIVNPQLI